MPLTRVLWNIRNLVRNPQITIEDRFMELTYPYNMVYYTVDNKVYLIHESKKGTL